MFWLKNTTKNIQKYKMKTANKLWKFQQDEINRILRAITYKNEKSIIVAHIVGSGKTTTTSVVASELLRTKVVDKVVIVAPFRMITDAFIDTWKTKNVWISPYGLSKKYELSLIRKARDSSDIIGFLIDRRTDILVSTHPIG